MTQTFMQRQALRRYLEYAPNQHGELRQCAALQNAQPAPRAPATLAIVPPAAEPTPTYSDWLRRLHDHIPLVWGVIAAAILIVDLVVIASLFLPAQAMQP
ncbi:MAG: hypothetical protein ABIU96_04075 [Rhodanobacter sp.]